MLCFPCLSSSVFVATIEHIFDGVERLLQLLPALVVLGGQAGQGLHQPRLALLEALEDLQRLGMLVHQLAMAPQRGDGWESWTGASGVIGPLLPMRVRGVRTTDGRYRVVYSPGETQRLRLKAYGVPILL